MNDKVLSIDKISQLRQKGNIKRLVFVSGVFQMTQKGVQDVFEDFRSSFLLENCKKTCLEKLASNQIHLTTADNWSVS